MKREIISDWAIMVAGATLLVLGVVVQLQNPGGYYGVEPNPYILIPEIVLYLSIFALGIDRLINDRGCGCTREVLGDIVVISSGSILTGMFVTVLISGKFNMPSPEAWFIIVRFIAGTAMVILGVERFVDDAKRSTKA